MVTVVEARRASTWIERFALPLAVCVMEAQPLGIVVALGTLMVARTIAAAPLSAAGIALLALGLLWWAMCVEQHHLRQRVNATHAVTALHLAGWLAALALLVGPVLPALLQGHGLATALIDAVLITWLWRSGMTRARSGFEYAPLARSFQVSFGILLGVMLVALILPAPQGPSLLTALLGSLPIFFLSGLIALSLARLGSIRHARRQDGSQADPTRIWLLALTLLGCALLALVLVLETVFSFARFELVLSTLTPLWNGLDTLVSWILYGIILVVFTPIYDAIAFVVGLLAHLGNPHHQQQPVRISMPHFKPPQNPQAIAPETLIIGRWLFVALVCLVLLFVVRAGLRRWRQMGQHEQLEEQREQLDARTLLRERWQQWWDRQKRSSRAASHHEPLDPTSARARYRQLLQGLAAAQHDLARLPTETPTEYEARLLTHLTSTIQNGQDERTVHNEPAEDADLLAELTHAYILERYGGQPADEQTRQQMPTWVRRLLTHLTGRTPTGERQKRRQAQNHV
jgi:hypothetical protein